MRTSTARRADADTAQRRRRAGSDPAPEAERELQVETAETELAEHASADSESAAGLPRYLDTSADTGLSASPQTARLDAALEHSDAAMERAAERDRIGRAGAVRASPPPSGGPAPESHAALSGAETEASAAAGPQSETVPDTDIDVGTDGVAEPARVAGGPHATTSESRSAELALGDTEAAAEGGVSGRLGTGSAAGSEDRGEATPGEPDTTGPEGAESAKPETETGEAGQGDAEGAAPGDGDGTRPDPAAVGGGGGGAGRAAASGAGGGGGPGAAAGADGLDALGTGDVALIDEELAEHQRWGAASARVGAAGSSTRADFIVDQAGAGALGGLGHGALMGAAMGAGTQAAEIGAGRLVARLAGPALGRSFPLPAIGAVIGGVMSAYDLATRDWGHTGETIGRFGEGGSIYEQLANSIAAVSEIIGIATAVLNVIAGVIGAISIAMWIITVLTVGVASPLAATLSTIAGAIGIATMVLDGINALVLQRLVTLFRALHSFTSQADPSDVEQQGALIGQAAGASAGFIGGMAGGAAASHGVGAGARRLGLSEPPPRVPDVEAPRPASGEGPTITADPPPVAEALPGGESPAAVAPEPAAPRQIADDGPATIDGAAPTEVPGPSRAPTEPAPADAPSPSTAPTEPASPVIEPSQLPADPNAPTQLPVGPDGMPEIPGPPKLPEIEPLPDYGPELPDWNPNEPSPYAPTDRPPASAPAPESVNPVGDTVPAPEAASPMADTVPAPADPLAPTETPSPSRGPTEPASPVTEPSQLPADPNAPTQLPVGPDGMPEIPGPPKLPQIEPLPDYGPELPDWNPNEPSPYAPTDRPPASQPTPEPAPESVNPSGDTVSAPAEPLAPTERPTPSTAPTEPAPPSGGEQLMLPGMDAPASPAPPAPAETGTTVPSEGGSATSGGRIEALTAPLELAGFTGNETVPTGLEPGSIGTYGRAVSDPHPFALESNPPGAEGATRGGGRLPQTGRQDAGVYYEHQTPAAVAHEVFPNHEYNSPSGRRRGGRDTVEALTISFPDAAKPFKDPLDAALLTEVRDRLASGEDVPPIEVVVRGAEHSQEAIGQSGAAVAPEQISKAFLGEMDQFHSPRFGYEEVRIGDALPADHPLRDVSQAEIDAHLDRVFDPYTAPPGTQFGLFGEHTPPAAPVPEQLSLPLPEPVDPRQLSLPFDGPELRPVADGPGARAVGEGSSRGTQPLTPEQFAEFAAMAEAMGMPADQIHQVSGPTAYGPAFDQLLIGPDIVPLPEGQRSPNPGNPANAALEPRAVLGHEIIGHREAELAGQARPDPWHEELQASTRAALHTPGLTREQMWLLTHDAAARRRFQETPGETIYVDTERYGGNAVDRRTSPGPSSALAGTRPVHDRPPSVIINSPRTAGQAPTADAASPTPASARPPVVGTGGRASALTNASIAARTPTRRAGAGGGTPETAAGGAPRAAETRRSDALAHGLRAGAIQAAGPGARALHQAWFGSGTRDARIERGGTIGAVAGAVVGGPVGALVGQQVGTGVARRAEDFNAGLERGGEPIVEPVNPAYPPPPGSGSRQDIADMQNRLLAILRARAQAEQLQAMMRGDAEHHEANQAPLTEFGQRTTAQVSATQAHQQAVAQRTAANQRQQQEEGNVTGAVEGYADRAAGLAVITGPLEAFTGFTYLAHALPDSPGVLVGAKRGILKMNRDGQNFLNALHGVDSAVAEQRTAQPARSSGIQANAGRLEATAGGNATAQTRLGEAQAGGQALAERNTARAADSRQREAQAAGTGSQLDGQAEQTRGEISDLAAQWQAWAQAHRQARVDAMTRTRAAMIARGWTPRAESPGGG